MICVAFSICFCFAEVNTAAGGTDDIDFAAFRQALEDSEDTKAASIGNSILGQLEQKHRVDPGFRTYKSKLDASEFLATQMIFHLNQATSEAGDALAGVFAEKNLDNGIALQSVAPAKKVYETSVKLFLTVIAVAQLPEQEKSFLAQYYDLKLRILTTEVAKAGQGLAIAEPGFKGTHDYVLVLPLLHASDQRAINIDVLPRWMQTPEQLAVLSDSCLLHFGFPFQAMALAKQAALVGNEPFSEIQFYSTAAKKCGESRSHIAADCLQKAMACVPGSDPNTTVALLFELVQVWISSGSHSLGAGQARNIFATYPEHHQAGEAIWLYFYCLSRCRDTDTILAHIDWALSDERCRAYEPKLMYVKWFALRIKGNDPVRLMAVEHELIKRYGNDPIIAPVLLFQGTRLMAGGDYESAREPLARLVEKFPSTKSAVQAKRILERLK
jgi:hypothetical protein